MAINLKKSSLQRIYEFGLKAMRKQGVPGAKPGGACDYLIDGSGHRCVAGHMLTDEQVKEAKEKDLGSIKGSPRAIEFFSALVGADRTGKKLNLMAAMQSAHDKAAWVFSNRGRPFLDEFEDNMQQVASDFALRYGAPGTTLRT